MPESISAALITHVGGAHVGSYLSALANAEQCSSVTLVDPDGRWNDDAKRVLGEKLRRVEPDLQQALRNGPPGMALVTMEARLAPPVIDSLLDAGCHVFAEKPACVRVENGMLGTITSGYYLDRGYHSHIKIWGSKGWLHLEPMKDQPLTWSTTVGPDAGKVQTWEGSKSPRGYTPIVQSAVKACAEMTDPPVTAIESLRALSTVFAIYDSAESGRTLPVE